MVCYDELRHEKLDLPHHYCVYAGRRDCHTHKHSHEEILARYGRQMKMCDRVPDVLSLDMGNQMYVATLDTATERDAFVRYVGAGPLHRRQRTDFSRFLFSHYLF